ncbi:LPS export ABC transporter ATP-binding protein [Blattabacterium cuenoti]|uniref:LPS export ABC transporter ATP-binding protein n=1 Tax=Blattabacterium cuenoti TaxID=1653831 RepID=UPI00163CBBE2|nr:LPS export ABC transporter ATP-binding protein [Blattabacterium cuenoti]
MILEAKNIYKKYKNKYVVKNVSIKLNQGEIVGLVGPNGAGKTTSFYIITGLIKPDNGKIFIGKDNITKSPLYIRSRKGIGYLSQDSSIFKKLTVEENILCILEMHKKYYKKKIEITKKLIKEFNLQNIKNNKGDSISLGERRRTEIARCLAINPKFILLDEPFYGIDPITIYDFQKILFSLKKKNIGILITDHNIQEVFTVTDRIYLMHNGEILKHGNSEKVIKSQLTKKIYLGNYSIIKKKIN